MGTGWVCNLLCVAVEQVAYVRIKVFGRAWEGTKNFFTLKYKIAIDWSVCHNKLTTKENIF